MKKVVKPEMPILCGFLTFYWVFPTVKLPCSYEPTTYKYTKSLSWFCVVFISLLGPNESTGSAKSELMKVMVHRYRYIFLLLNYHKVQLVNQYIQYDSSFLYSALMLKQLEMIVSTSMSAVPSSACSAWHCLQCHIGTLIQCHQEWKPKLKTSLLR